MNIIFLTQYYPPELGAPQTRLHELAIGLQRNGIQVTVLTAMPNYPQGWIYSGYKGWLKKEIIDGVQVIRTVIFPTQSAKMLPRLMSYFSFILSSLIIGGRVVKNADFLLSESPPLFLGFSGFLLSRWKHAKWIFNVSDLWPESVVELGIVNRDSISHKLSNSLEKKLYKNAWVVSGQSKTILENIRRRFPKLRTYHLPNGVDTFFFHPLDKQCQNKCIQIVYAGLHGLAQGLEQILWAANELSKEEYINFTFIGDGPEKRKLISLAEELNLKKVCFLESVPKEKMPEILNIADILVVPLKIQLTGAVPSKLYEAMAMGKPVILIAGSEAAKIVIDADCGLVIQPGDVHGLVSSIIYLRNHPEKCKRMGENGRKIAIQNHDRTQIANLFADFLIKECRNHK